MELVSAKKQPRIVVNQAEKYRRELAQLPREKLLEFIAMQDPQTIEEIELIEDVFKHKMRHLTWEDGSPIEGRPLSNYELALLIDPPFVPDDELTQMGISVKIQREMHVAKDTVMWSKQVLGMRPRAYQTLMLRHPALRKVFRAGRRLGKSTAMAMLILHYCYTHNDGRVLIIVPMKSQAELLYQEVMRQANQSEVVKNTITRAVMSPQFTIEFSNGSTARFFTSGIRSGGKTDVARGQEAHLIILDELDMMNKDDLVAIYAMLQQTSDNQPDKMMVGASTPTGRRELFWDWCKSDRFQEFWFPSYVNPFFDAELEEEMRERYTENAYRHEIEADWGEDAQGVYPKRYIELAFDNTTRATGDGKAISGWEYLPRPTGSKHSFYIMGVDWDKYGAGVNMVVLEVCGRQYEDEFFRNKVKVIYREETIKEEYTLINAVDRVIELNKIFDFRHIYIDRGYGEVQKELLHKYGKEHPETKLHKKVKGIAFKEAVNVRDPWTKQEERKEAKPFMVDNLRQILERGQLTAPGHDDLLFHQLLGYVVERITQLGVPVFGTVGDIGDHAHDALILACFALTENYGDLMSVDYAHAAKVVSRDFIVPVKEMETKEIVGQKNYFTNPISIKRSMALAPNRSSYSPIQRKMF